jgi:hypothetical protein
MNAEEQVARQRLSVLELAEALDKVSEAGRRHGIPCTQFYDYQRHFQPHATGSIDRALAVFPIRACAVLLARLMPNQAHLGAIAHGNYRRAAEARQPHVMEKTAATREVLSFRSFLSYSGALLKRYQGGY